MRLAAYVESIPTRTVLGAGLASHQGNYREVQAGARSAGDHQPAAGVLWDAVAARPAQCLRVSGAVAPGPRPEQEGSPRRVVQRGQGASRLLRESARHQITMIGMLHGGSAAGKVCPEVLTWKAVNRLETAWTTIASSCMSFHPCWFVRLRDTIFPASMLVLVLLTARIWASLSTWSGNSEENKSSSLHMQLGSPVGA